MKKYIDFLVKELERKKNISDAGVSFFVAYKADILKQDKLVFLIDCFNHSEINYKYMQYLLLTIPEVWKDFSLDDWKFIIRNVKRKSKYKVLYDDEGCFEDIKFLFKWIEVDSVDLYRNDSKINERDKNILDRVIKSYAYDIYKDPEHSNLDYEWFEEGVYGDIMYFEIMKERLLKQGALEANFDLFTE